LQFPATSSEFSADLLELEGFKDLGTALHEALQGESAEQISRCLYYLVFLYSS